jgi:hypothetical protein
MFEFTAISSYTMFLAILALFVLIIAWQKQRTGKQIAVWLFSGILGILLGCAGTLAGGYLAGYKFAENIPDAAVAAGNGAVPGDTAAGGGPGGAGAPPGGGGPGGGGPGGGGRPGGGPGGGRPGGGPGFGGPGGGGPGGGGFGGAGRAPTPQQELLTLVRKLSILTGDVHIELSSEQAANLVKALEGIEKEDQLPNDAAKAAAEKLTALLDDSQKAKLELIGLPRRGGGMAGNPQAPADANPFADAAAFESLDQLRKKFSSGAATNEGAGDDATKTDTAKRNE